MTEYGKLTMGLIFLFGNFVYQYFQIEPNYLLAIDRSYFQLVAMIVISLYPSKNKATK
tara:strand:- start:1466 stop:1639 length:174 start_codon:yes stop_codon:yes gene_type:complete